ncbi:MAG: ATP-binding protein, partial [Lentisphaerota bacterium]
MLASTLRNLVSNATKFTCQGGIITLAAKSGNEHSSEISISDTGIGIPEEMQHRLFTRFAQANLSITRGYEGAGLGLAICKGLVELLGGKIWYDSEYNLGTTFYFSLPYSSTKKTVLEQVAKTYDFDNMSKVKILIAEDDLNSYKYLAKLFSKTNFEILHAENGLEAVEMVNNTPDITLVLMDIRMPFLDGKEATIQIKIIKCIYQFR